VRDHLPLLAIAVPLTAAMIAPLLGRSSVALARGLAILASLLTLAAALGALAASLAAGPVRYALAGWPPPFGIELVVDPLSGSVASLVAAIATLVAVWGVPSPDRPGGGVFWALFLLLVAGLVGIAVTGDLFNLFVFLEISALAGYALLGAHDARSRVAGFRYLLVGTVAGSFYLLGVGYLYALTGTLNMADMAARLPAHAGSPLVTLGVALIVAGLAAKSALFPLHGWLPDAYAYAPPAVVAFVAAVASKVSVYALIRILFDVVGSAGPLSTLLGILGWTAAAASVAGAGMAIAQQDFRRLLAYSSVSQMGYIFLGLAIGNEAAFTGALLHLVSHAVMKANLFLVAGGVLWRRGGCRLDDFGGLSRQMPVTTTALAVTALSMAGLPPTAGFFSKYYLVLGAIQEGAWWWLGAIVLSTLLGIAYLLGVLERAWFGERASDEVGGELPPRLLVPIVTLTAAVLAIGLFNQDLVEVVLRHALPASVR
jgi:multicomponent Na+:H+ antiporter subunit D